MAKKGYGQNTTTSSKTKYKVEVSGGKIIGIDIPFMNLVALFIKGSIAAVPAAIIAGVFWDDTWISIRWCDGINLTGDTKMQNNQLSL